MRNKATLYLCALACLTSLTGCTGYGPPHILQMKPYTMIDGGDQFGRDQLANRWLVSKKTVSIKGKNKNEIITLLGQPQQIQVIEHRVSEDWYFIYYKMYKTKPDTEEGSFLVRFYNDEVLDVVNLK